MSDTTWAEQVLDELDDVKEDLLTLYEDIQQDADVRDPAARRATLAVLTEFDQRFEPLERAINEMMAFIERVTGVTPASREAVRDAARATALEKALAVRNSLSPVRTLRPLDPDQPHPITEDFRFKRPCAFTLASQRTEVTTWKQLYTLACEQLAALDPARFAALPDVPEFSASDATIGFSRARERFKKPISLPQQLYCEGSLSARHVSDNLRRLLTHFGLAESDLVIYLREEWEGV